MASLWSDWIKTTQDTKNTISSLDIENYLDNLGKSYLIEEFDELINFCPYYVELECSESLIVLTSYNEDNPEESESVRREILVGNFKLTEDGNLACASISEIYTVEYAGDDDEPKYEYGEALMLPDPWEITDFGDVDQLIELAEFLDHSYEHDAVVVHAFSSDDPGDELGDGKAGFTNILGENFYSEGWYNSPFGNNFIDAYDGTPEVIYSKKSKKLSGGQCNLKLTGKKNIKGIGNNLDNQITGNKGKNLLKGLSGDDILIGGSGKDNLQGGVGDDILKGGSGKDVLKGGSGKDVLNGGWGKDILKGGSGADTYMASKGKDTIHGFNIQEGDLLSGFGDTSELDISDSGEFCIVSGNGYTARLKGVDAADLIAAQESVFV